MREFGQARLIGLDHQIEVGVPSYRGQVARGLRRDGPMERLRYLARVNHAYNYIFWLRTRSNDPAYLERMGRIERGLHQPPMGEMETDRAAAFRKDDYHFAPKMIDPALVSAFADDLEQPQTYFDAYAREFRHTGRPEESDHPFLCMNSLRLFRNENFLRICNSPDLIKFCREVLGPDAALSWAWSWISRPTESAYQNQNWHRDCAEPLNFIRVFVPLRAIESSEDGPTEFIPSTSSLREFYDVRRYRDEELAELKQQNGAGVFLAEPGDAYFLNTFALHRGTPPVRQRAVISLLVSLSPSFRTPTIAKMDRQELSPELRDAIGENRRFFRHFF